MVQSRNSSPRSLKPNPVKVMICVTAVDAISKRAGEPFRAYYERVKANDLAVVVKWHDVADNADPARLALVAPDTQERLRAKYGRARAMLAAPRAVEM